MLAAAAIAALIVGATFFLQGSDPRQTEDEAEGEVFQQLSPPPESPPSVTLVSSDRPPQDGEIVWESWVYDGELQVSEANGLSAPGATDHQLCDGAVTIVIPTDSMPNRIQVLEYSEVGQDQIPTGEIREFDCLEEEVSDCDITADQGIRATFEPDHDSRIIIVNLGWTRELDEVQANPELPSEVGAAWAFYARE